MEEVSPGIYRPVELYSVGLTNNPNIPGNTIGLNEADAADASFSAMIKTHIIALLAALGRPLANASSVTDDQLAAAVNEATPVATQLVTASNELGTTKTTLATTQSQLSATNTKLSAAELSLTNATNEAATLRTSLAQERTARAETVLVVAINEGRITTAQRVEWLGKLTAQGADFAKVEGDLKKLKAVNTRSQLGDIGDRKDESAQATRERVSAINEAIKKVRKEDPAKDHATAYREVIARPEFAQAAS
jgi:hypothetical protein